MHVYPANTVTGESVPIEEHERFVVPRYRCARQFSQRIQYLGAAM